MAARLPVFSQVRRIALTAPCPIINHRELRMNNEFMPCAGRRQASISQAASKDVGQALQSFAAGNGKPAAA
jgi:hypothetical protein